MTTFTKLPAALLCISLSTAAVASEVREVWEIQAIGFLSRPTITIQVVRVDDRIFIDTPSLIELGFPQEKLEKLRLYELNELGFPKIDKAASSIRLEVAPKYLTPTRFDMGRRDANVGSLPPALSALIVNYEANVTSENKGRAGLMLDSTFYVSGKYRVQHRGMVATGQPGVSRWTRLDSSITYEDPVKTYSWTLGDTISATGLGINPVSFTGFQYKKDYALQPGFVLQPVTELNGSAALPSTLEVYLDNRRILTNNIPAGPFSIANLIPQIGSNNARVIVRDSFGQEQVITQSLLGATGLLKPGYNNYAFQAGRLRTGGSSYEGLFTSGFFATGINNIFTIELNGEASRDSKNLAAVHHAGLSLYAATPLGSFSARGRAGTGRTVTLGYANGWRNGDRSTHINATTTRNSDDYRVLGSLSTPSARTSTIQGSLQWARGTTMTLYALRDDRGSNTGISLTFAPTVQYKPTYAISLERSAYSSVRDLAATFSMSLPFDMGGAKRSQHLSTSARYQDRHFITKSASFSNSTLEQTGFSYNGQVERSYGYDRVDATVSQFTHSGERGISVASFNGKIDARGRIRGSTILSGDGLNFNPWLTGGYARVESDIADVDILVNGSPLGKTNKKGIGYVPILASYTNTSLRLDPDSEEAVDAAPVEVMVRPQGGVSATFTRITGTLLAIEGVTEGTLTVAGKIYPITDRGAYLELAQGSYKGKLDNGREIIFTIPKPGKAMLQTINIK